METFADLKFEQQLHQNGIQAKRFFPNGYGVSVVRSKFSYGGKEGLYEVAILDGETKICYTTPITDDVLGWRTEKDVTEIMAQVQQLPKLEKSVEEEQEAPTFIPKRKTDLEL